MELMEQLSRLNGLCPTGYAIALHIRYTTPQLLFQTYPKEWIDIYSEKGLVLKDPTVLWGFTNTGNKLWSSLKDLDSEDVLGQASKYGLKFGFTFALDIGDSKTISSFARPDREFNDDEIKALSQVVTELHQATDNVATLSPDTLAELRKMSVDFSGAPE